MPGQPVCPVEGIQILRINQGFIQQPEAAAADPDTLKGFGTQKIQKEFTVTAAFL